MKAYIEQLQDMDRILNLKGIKFQDSFITTYWDEIGVLEDIIIDLKSDLKIFEEDYVEPEEDNTDDLIDERKSLSY